MIPPGVARWGGVSKWLAGIEFVADFSEVGGGHGGYNADHEFFGYRQSL